MIWLAELMPLCFVRWYSVKHMERVSGLAAARHAYVNPRPGVLFVVPYAGNQCTKEEAEREVR